MAANPETVLSWEGKIDISYHEREVVMVKVKDLFDIAYQVEAAGYSFYKNLAQEVSGDRADLFDSLADQERDHRRKFEEIFEEMKSDREEREGSWPEKEVSSFLRSYGEFSVFDKHEEVPEDYSKALKMAIEAEKDSIILYQDIKYLLRDREAVEKIIDEEKDHLESLIEQMEEVG